MNTDYRIKAMAKRGRNGKVIREDEVLVAEKGTALDLPEKTHAWCPYSESIRTDIGVKLNMLKM